MSVTSYAKIIGIEIPSAFLVLISEIDKIYLLVTCFATVLSFIIPTGSKYVYFLAMVSSCYIAEVPTDFLYVCSIVPVSCGRNNANCTLVSFSVLLLAVYLEYLQGRIMALV